MMIKQYCFIKLLLNQFLFYILYSSFIILVFLYYLMFLHILMCHFMYICDLFYIRLYWDKFWICEMHVYVM
jgi:hypothetical protein